MQTIKLSPFLFLVCLVFAACFPEAKQQQNTRYCANERTLFSVEDSIRKVKISYNDQPEAIIDALESQLAVDLCWKEVSIGLIVANKTLLNVYVVNACNDGAVGSLSPRSEVDILLNLYGRLMVNDEVIPIDSVKFWLPSNFPDTRSSFTKEILINWDISTPKDSIERTFENIVDGYLGCYESLAQELFGKELCDLSNSEIDQLRNILPFRVVLGVGGYGFRPPIPWG